MANPKRRIIPVFIPNEGCSNNCVFCDQRRITGAPPVDLRDVSDFINSVLQDKRKPSPLEVAFYGGSFTALTVELQISLLEAARPLLALDPLNSIRISTRPDFIDEQILDRLQSYGVKTIELGAQSMCDDVLSASDRGHTPQDVEDASSLIKSKGFSLVLQMMTGLPEDSAEKSIFTAKRLIGLSPDAVRIYPTVVIKGSRLYELWKSGAYAEHTVADAVALCAELCPMFFDAGIPVIRLGLNPTAELSSGSAAAGAYHPSLGELVYSRIYYNKAEKLLMGVTPGSDVVLAVSKGAASKMTGSRRRNIEALTAKFSLRSLKVIETDLPPGKVVTHPGEVKFFIENHRR